MKNIELFTLIMILVTTVFAGCVEAPEKTTTPVPTTTQTIATPTAIQATSIPTPAATPKRILAFTSPILTRIMDSSG